MTKLVKNLLSIKNTTDYKIHFARNNKSREPIHGGEPLHIWTGKETKNKLEWQDWQRYRPNNNAFNRRYIFSLMRFYPEEDTWLFGGVFEVLERGEQKYAHSYKVKLTDIDEKFVRCLKIKSPYTARQARTRMERYYDEFEVKEILPKPYEHKKPY